MPRPLAGRAGRQVFERSRITIKRFVSQKEMSREHALWLCRTILRHYRSDGGQTEDERDRQDLAARHNRASKYKRGRDWVIQPVGYDLKEIWHGTPQAGIREAWAALVALPVPRTANPDSRRRYHVFGLANSAGLNIATYRITEVHTRSWEDSYHDYVLQCLRQIMPDAEEIPDYDPRHR